MIAVAATLAAAWLAASAVFGQAEAPQVPTPGDPWTWAVGGGGALGMALLGLFGFRSEWWVTGRVYRRRVEEIKELRAEQRDERREHAALVERTQLHHEELIAVERRATETERERVANLLERSTQAVTEAAGTQRQVIDLLLRLDPPPPPAPLAWKPPHDGG